MELKLPLKIGDVTEYKRDGEVVKSTVIAKEKVEIGAENYPDCFRIESKTDTASEVFWESPESGCVKSETIYSNGFKVVVTLREFKTPPK